jgi:hypothetical protein
MVNGDRDLGTGIALKSVSIALLRRDFEACVRYGCENRFGDAMCLLRIIGILSLGTLLVQRFNSALSNRGGNNRRQLKVVSHAAPYKFDRLTPVDSPLREAAVRRWI